MAGRVYVGRLSLELVGFELCLALLIVKLSAVQETCQQALLSATWHVLTLYRLSLLASFSCYSFCAASIYQPTYSCLGGGVQQIWHAEICMGRGKHVISFRFVTSRGTTNFASRQFIKAVCPCRGSRPVSVSQLPALDCK